MGGLPMSDALFSDPIQTTWQRPKKASGCRRDPAAGPGSCFHWWEGCPDNIKRGCYLRWARQMHDLGYVPVAPGVAGVKHG
jgi:hypothetical protein